MSGITRYRFMPCTGSRNRLVSTTNVTQEIKVGEFIYKENGFEQVVT